jgi:hypothetical protein
MPITIKSAWAIPQKPLYSRYAIDIRKACCYSLRKIGAVAQLGERMNGIHEVVGSIPISSTIK